MVSLLFYFFAFGLPLHSGRHLSLNDSHTKMEEQELGRGGLDNQVISSLNARGEWRARDFRTLREAGLVWGWTGPLVMWCCSGTPGEA